MELKGLIFHSQESIIGPFSEPVEFCPTLSNMHLNIASHLHLDHPSDHFPSGFLTKILYACHFTHAIPFPSYPRFVHPEIFW
jgi:hypothetical protein